MSCHNNVFTRVQCNSYRFFQFQIKKKFSQIVNFKDNESKSILKYKVMENVLIRLGILFCLIKYSEVS